MSIEGLGLNLTSEVNPRWWNKKFWFVTLCAIFSTLVTVNYYIGLCIITDVLSSFVYCWLSTHHKLSKPARYLFDRSEYSCAISWIIAIVRKYSFITHTSEGDMNILPFLFRKGRGRYRKIKQYKRHSARNYLHVFQLWNNICTTRNYVKEHDVKENKKYKKLSRNWTHA